MPTRSREQAEKDIGIREGVFVSLIWEAHDKFYDTCGQIAAVLGGGTKASVIRDLSKDGLARFAAIDPGLDMTTRRNAVSFRMGDFCFRLKKLNKRMRAKPPRTEAGLRFDRNIQDDQGALALDDTPLTTGYLGYVANVSNLRRPTIFFVVNRADGRPAWPPIELIAADTSASANVPQIRSAHEEEPETRSRARVKKTPEKKRKENG